MLVLLMWKWMSLLFFSRNHLLRYWDCLFLLKWIGTVILYMLLKLPPRKLKPWLVLWSFFFLRLLCIYKSTIRPCIEYYCHVWAGASSCFLELLDKLQKQLCRIVIPSLAASLKSLTHRRNVASLRLFCRYCFGRCSSETGSTGFTSLFSREIYSLFW